MTHPDPDEENAVHARPGDPGATGALGQGGESTEVEPGEGDEKVYASRAIAWLVVAVIVITGVVLYFLYSRRVPPLVG